MTIERLSGEARGVMPCEQIASAILDQWESADFTPPLPGDADYLAIAAEYLKRTASFNAEWADPSRSPIDYGDAYRARRKAWADAFHYMYEACRRAAPADDLRAENERLRAIMATIISRCDTAKQQCREGAPVSAFNLACGILGQIGSARAALSQKGGDA